MMTEKADLFRALAPIAAGDLAVCLLLVPFSVSQPAQAAPPQGGERGGAKCKIAFSSDRAGNLDIWVMNANEVGRLSARCAEERTARSSAHLASAEAS